MLYRIDLFPQPIPGFNLKGRSTVASIPGCLVSFLILVMLFLYGTHKLGQLISKTNPNVSSYVEKSIFTSDDVLNMKENGIRIAFGFEGYLD